MVVKRYDGLRREELIQLLEQRDADEAGGIRLSYKGQTPPWRIVRMVQPRRQQIDRKLSVGGEEDQSGNLLMEGENLQGMVSLYKYRGQVDLILTDPPYNTGQDFRYNDRWDEDPNDPDLGRIIPVEDGSRHSKWLRFMTPRLWMMREMLKPNGVLAICIDHRELFRLGLLLDQMFGEANRLGIINWQKTTAKNDKKHIASLTEYILVYAKDAALAKSGLLERSEKSNNRFGNTDKDIDGDWKQGDPTAVGDDNPPSMVYAIQSPFTGQLHFPPPRRHWSNEKRRMRAWLEDWGSAYEERTIPGSRYRGLVIKDAPLPSDKDFEASNVHLLKAKEAALSRLEAGSWPRLYFGHTGDTKPMIKVYASQVKAGSVPTSFWVDDGEEPFAIETVSWQAPESGRSREGIEELDAVVGPGHGFETVKPLRLFTKVVQIWCPPNGIVLDPFAGSGTTAHAVLQVNLATGGSRRFILMEQGRPARGDPYARSLTTVRVTRAISGERVTGGKLEVTAEPLPGGFRFIKLSQRVDADAVLALEREEMIDLLLTTHWDQTERSSAHLRRLPAQASRHLFGISGRGEGYFLVWRGPGEPSVLNREHFRQITDEAREAALKPPFHVYARISTYSGPNIEFYQIPDRILEKLGFNTTVQPFSTGAEEAEEQAADSAA